MKFYKIELLFGLRSAAKRLRANAAYSWGHPGCCNCGHLIQSLTKLTQWEIQQAAYFKGGEWKDLSSTHCETSGLDVDKIITILFGYGLNFEDIIHLENLSDPEILNSMPIDSNTVKRNDRIHLIYYLEAWADKLENKLFDVRETQGIEQTTNTILVQSEENLIFAD